MKKLILVGEAPPDPHRGMKRAFDPSARSGRRLAELFGVDDVSETFTTVNIVNRWPGRTAHGAAFPAGLAKANARNLWRSLDLDGDLLLVGRRVSNAFGLGDAPYLRWGNYDGDEVVRRVAVFPHPSGTNRWWNEEGNPERARRFARRVIREYV